MKNAHLTKAWVLKGQEDWLVDFRTVKRAKNLQILVS